jgi:L-asparaginase
MLKHGRNLADIRVRTLMMMDSLELDDSDREIILNNCRRCERDRIVITHGTDSMVDTARYLGERLSDKTVILTGAMRPYVFGSSDGQFNLGAALAFAQTLPAGVYIAMNGRYFAYDNVRKNREKGIFETLN